MSTLELDDIQADVAVQYPGWGITYCFYKLQRHGRMVADPGIAATVLKNLAHSVTKSGQVRSNTTSTLTVGFTAAGLEAIGVSTDTMTTLPDAFVDGMYRRADKLGDDTASWDADFKNNHIDIVVVLRYTSVEARDDARKALSNVFSDKFATEKFDLDAQLIDSDGASDRSRGRRRVRALRISRRHLQPRGRGRSDRDDARQRRPRFSADVLVVLEEETLALAADTGRRVPTGICRRNGRDGNDPTQRPPHP